MFDVFRVDMLLCLVSQWGGNKAINYAPSHCLTNAPYTQAHVQNYHSPLAAFCGKLYKIIFFLFDPAPELTVTMYVTRDHHHHQHHHHHHRHHLHYHHLHQIRPHHSSGPVTRSHDRINYQFHQSFANGWNARVKGNRMGGFAPVRAVPADATSEYARRARGSFSFSASYNALDRNQKPSSHFPAKTHPGTVDVSTLLDQTEYVPGDSVNVFRVVPHQRALLPVDVPLWSDPFSRGSHSFEAHDNDIASLSNVRNGFLNPPSNPWQRRRPLQHQHQQQKLLQQQRQLQQQQQLQRQQQQRQEQQLQQQQGQQVPQTQVTTEKYASQSQWGYQVLPTLYSIYQKVEVTPWVSSKHNMGMTFNRTTWYDIVRCARHFCEYDDYNWDWSLQHVSQQCLKQKLHVMVVKGPRVFHIGECGVHHKKSNCESNQVISKVQKVLKAARGSQQLFPRSISLTQTSLVKKTKLRKGNGGWGDQRDHQLCFNMTLVGR